MTLLEGEGELCMGHQGRQGRLAQGSSQLRISLLGDPLPDACGCQAQLKALVSFSSEMGCLRLQKKGERG